MPRPGDGPGRGRAVASDPGGGERPVGADAGDVPQVAVAHVPAGAPEATVVGAGDDPVADPDDGPVGGGDAMARDEAGAGEAMLEEAYTAWQTDTEHGRPAILIAPNTRTVGALNTRAHNDRAAAGLVTRHGVTTPDGTVIGIGDRVVTRSNNRRLRGAGGYVRNGDLWDVTGIGSDGSLTATRVRRHSTPTAGSVTRSRHGVVLPPDYVAEHVDLGYATTTHRAQGITVDRAHVLAAPGMVRENLYVAMTRGRHHNHVYVAVDDVDPSCDDLPDAHPAPSGRDVLEQILTTSGAELSATQTVTARRNDATSLKRLGPIRQTLIADASASRWTQVCLL